MANISEGSPCLYQYLSHFFYLSGTSVHGCGNTTTPKLSYFLMSFSSIYPLFGVTGAQNTRNKCQREQKVPRAYLGLLIHVLSCLKTSQR